MQKLINRNISLALFLFLSISLLQMGCSSTSKTGKGAGIGAAAGAVLGGVIGNTQDEAGKGAIIGAVVGGAAGAIIGKQMDKQAEELEAELEDATIERVGEGIQITMESAILFDFNSSEVQPQSRDALAKLAQSLQEYENTDIVVVGHTDSKGSDTYNQSLSERRAQAAAALVLANGVDQSRVTTIGRGEAEPVADNAMEAGRQKNRRVEIAIYANEDYRAELEAQEGN